MSDLDQETVADIMAEIRAYGAQPPPRCMWLEIADRVETAARRERDHAIEHATRHAEAVARDNCRDCVYNPRGKNYEGVNAAAMREALTKISESATYALKYRHVGLDYEDLQGFIEEMGEDARAALADATTEKSSAVGNAAAMREALDAALRFIGNLEIEPYLPLDEEASELRQKIIDALYAPARNCDIHTDFTDAITTLANERNWHDGKWNSERYCILASWLLAPAERKGEGDGR